MNNYSKTKSLIIYIIFGLIFAIGTILTFVPMSIGSKDYESFIGATALSKECTDTISAIYTYAEDDKTDVNKSIDLMGGMLEKEFGKNSVSVYKLGEDRIRVDVAESATTASTDEIEEYLTGFTSGKLKITNNSSPTATIEENKNLLEIDGWTDIDSVQTKTYKGSYGIEVSFKKSGKTTYGLMTGQKVYIYVNDKAFPSDNYNTVDLTSESTTFTIWFSSNEYIEYYKNTFEVGMIPLYFNPDNVEFIHTEANPVALTYTAVAISTLVFALYLFAIIKFRVPAIMYVITSIIGNYVLLFLLQAMPWVEVGIVTMASIGMVKLVEFALFALIHKRVKDEFMLGKSIETSFEDAYKRTIMPVIDTLSVLLLGGLIFAVAGRFELVTIGTTVAISSVVSAIVLLLGTRLLTTCYFAFNQTSNSCYALPKRMEGETNE